MGMIKRIFKQTSNRLLSKLGVQHSSSQRLVVNQALPNGLASVQAKKMRARRTTTATKKSRHTRPTATQDAAMLSALTANLPQVQFHHVHGPNAELSAAKMVARRTQSFCHALVFSNRVILPNERVYIKVLEISKGWSGTIRFGFTAVDPATLSNQVPKHACPDMTNAGHTWARALADEVVRRNSVIHFSYNSEGFIHYGINNQDCGIFYANVNTSQNLWFIVDIYGLTAAVELIDPRMCATGELDSSFSADENYVDSGARATLAKLESHQRLRKKRARKMAHHGLVPELGQWPSHENWTLNGQARLHQQETLPNLSSMELPQTQQNIYSPMPNALQLPPPPPQTTTTTTGHDYYQILNTSGQHHPDVAPVQKSSASRERASNELNESTATTSNSTSVQDELCHQLENVRVRESYIPQRPFRFVPTTTPDIEAYVAYLERSRPEVPMEALIDFNVPPRRSRVRPDPPSTYTPDRVYMMNIPKQMSSSTKPKSSRTRSSSSSATTAKNSNSTSTTTTTANNKSRDNNNPPTGRDCPICFERPINCVLYQCGHMCTCYECGVKQWKTQSRTCPICRTVIKDVIKTYMS